MSRKRNVTPKQAHSLLGDTAFPKINGKRDVFLGALKSLVSEENLVGEVIMEGTVKLHGMHADIVFDILPNEVNALFPADGEHHPRGKIKFQSRNREVLPAESQNGWPKTVAYHVDALFELKRQILGRFQQKNPHLIVDPEYPLIIGGEWIGQKVQRDVGICQLSQRFIILSINVNGHWQNDSEYADLEVPDANIYNIYRVPAYKVRFNLRMMQEENPAFEEMQQLANQVERCCPFAAAFGVPESQGEGIVWKVGTPGGRAQASKWLKTKGPIASGIKPQPLVSSLTDDVVTNHSRKAPGAPKARSIGKKQSLNPTDFLAKRLVTDRRVEQAFEYLDEMCIDETSIDNWRTLADWLVDDIFEEDKNELIELEKKYVDVPGFKFDVEFKKSITRIGRERYIEGMVMRKAVAAKEEKERRKKEEADERLGYRRDKQGIDESSTTASPTNLSDDSQKWMRAIQEDIPGAEADKTEKYPASNRVDDAAHNMICRVTATETQEVILAEHVPPNIDQVHDGGIWTEGQGEIKNQTEHHNNITNGVTLEAMRAENIVEPITESFERELQAPVVNASADERSRRQWSLAVRKRDAKKFTEGC